MAGVRTPAPLMLGYWLLGLVAGLCFKEGGTDSSHRLAYFVAGNVLGISSTVLLMGLYARMNVNLAMLLATSGGFILFQLTLWAVYRTPLTFVQWVGIAVVGAGIALVVGPTGKRSADTAGEAAAHLGPGRKEG